MARKPAASKPAKVRVVPQDPMNDKAGRVLSWWSQMDGQMAQWRTTWQQIGDYFFPRKSQINIERAEGQVDDLVDLFNTVGVEAGRIASAGTTDFFLSGRFFRYEPPMRNAGDDAKRWLENATEVTLDRLLASNFYIESAELFDDDTYFGTADLLAEMRDGALLFKNDRVGTYGIAEGVNGVVNTVVRKFTLTTQQAVAEYGIENVGRVIREEYESGDLVKRAKRHEFLQSISPRPADEINPRAMGGTQFPIASCHVLIEAKLLVRESGYEEMPIAVTRYLKWDKDPFGWSPAMLALPTCKQLNFIEAQLDSLAETKATPRVLLPSSMDGRAVDFRARGITFYDESNPNAKPEEWLTGADYEIGLERIKSKEDLVKRLFNVDMWQMLANIEREMTAYEVASRKAEKTSAISPSFYRKQPEFFNIIMPRVFALLFRNGDFGDPSKVPQELLTQCPNGPRLLVPRVVLTGKLAQAMRESENNAANAWLQNMLPLAQVAGPEVLEPIDLQKYSAGSAKNLGVPVEWTRSEGDMRTRAAARAQQAAQAQALQTTEVGAKAAGDLGRAPAGVQQALTSSLSTMRKPQA